MAQASHETSLPACQIAPSCSFDGFTCLCPHPGSWSDSDVSGYSLDIRSTASPILFLPLGSEGEQGEDLGGAILTRAETGTSRLPRPVRQVRSVASCAVAFSVGSRSPSSRMLRISHTRPALSTIRTREEIRLCRLGTGLSLLGLLGCVKPSLKKIPSNVSTQREPPMTYTRTSG